MSIKSDIINALENNRGKPVSGQQLADELGVSRAAVWKAIQALLQEGYNISATRCKGYMLDESSDILSEAGLLTCLRSRGINTPLVFLSETDSTNIQAKRIALEGGQHGTAVVANKQTAGRGRLGRSFYSPADTGIYLSVLLSPKGAIPKPQMITVYAAVATARAIEKVCGISVGIKWVNDLYFNKKKICGILTEATLSMEGGGIDNVIVGIGINCTGSEEELPDEIRSKAGFLGKGGYTRNELAAEVVAQILKYGDCVFPDDVIEEYRKRSILTGKRITYTKNGSPDTGCVLGISDSGCLIVRSDSGDTDELFSGEVSITQF